jgi:uncharacterized alpha-E superfamily protein
MTEDYLNLMRKWELDPEKGEIFVNNNSQGKSIMARIAGRVRRARTRLRISEEGWIVMSENCRCTAEEPFFAP